MIDSGDVTFRLPTLGDAIAINAQCEFNTEAIFAGGISVNEGPFEQSVTFRTSEIVDIRGCIKWIDPEHFQQLAEVVAYTSYKRLTSPDSEPPIYLM